MGGHTRRCRAPRSEFPLQRVFVVAVAVAVIRVYPWPSCCRCRYWQPVTGNRPPPLPLVSFRIPPQDAGAKVTRHGGEESCSRWRTTPLGTPALLTQNPGLSLLPLHIVRVSHCQSFPPLRPVTSSPDHLVTLFSSKGMVTRRLLLVGEGTLFDPGGRAMVVSWVASQRGLLPYGETVLDPGGKAIASVRSSRFSGSSLWQWLYLWSTVAVPASASVRSPGLSRAFAQSSAFRPRRCSFAGLQASGTVPVRVPASAVPLFGELAAWRSTDLACAVHCCRSSRRDRLIVAQYFSAGDQAAQEVTFFLLLFSPAGMTEMLAVELSLHRPVLRKAVAVDARRRQRLLTRQEWQPKRAGKHQDKNLPIGRIVAAYTR